ncbi:unnamed protein product [Amoebophrya sp. A25]|nr:unnamed protein product [Amoebophrya sp. A25]|eukprot:GSA25T00011219001.1
MIPRIDIIISTELNFLTIYRYCVRVYYLHGFYIVSYALGIYLLNLVLGFLSPAVLAKLPSISLSTTKKKRMCMSFAILESNNNSCTCFYLSNHANSFQNSLNKVNIFHQIDPEDAEDEDGPTLPSLDGPEGEYRPFSRKLPEFKFWVAATRMVWISIAMTFFSVFDLPVFWPILLMYFILLVFITMKDRVQHMIKYKYVPFSWGKQTYRDMTKVQLTSASGWGGYESEHKVTSTPRYKNRVRRLVGK